MDTYFPMSRHFPASWHHIRAYVVHFSNADTLNKYLQAVRKAHKVLRLDTTEVEAVIAMSKRGALSMHIRAPKGRLVKEHFREVVRRLLDRFPPSWSRFLSVSRLFMFRVLDEALPLQYAGRHNPQDSVQAL